VGENVVIFYELKILSKFHLVIKSYST